MFLLVNIISLKQSFRTVRFSDMTNWRIKIEIGRKLPQKKRAVIMLIQGGAIGSA
jgi:hypothetical protein